MSNPYVCPECGSDRIAAHFDKSVDETVVFIIVDGKPILLGRSDGECYSYELNHFECFGCGNTNHLPLNLWDVDDIENPAFWESRIEEDSDVAL